MLGFCSPAPLFSTFSSLLAVSEWRCKAQGDRDCCTENLPSHFFNLLIMEIQLDRDFPLVLYTNTQHLAQLPVSSLCGGSEQDVWRATC